MALNVLRKSVDDAFQSFPTTILAGLPNHFASFVMFLHVIWNLLWDFVGFNQHQNQFQIIA